MFASCNIQIGENNKRRTVNNLKGPKMKIYRFSCS